MEPWAQDRGCASSLRAQKPHLACRYSVISDGNEAGEVWAIALSENGQYIAATSFDGRINVWDNLVEGAKIREFETKGSFGMSIDLVPPFSHLVKCEGLMIQ